MTGFHALQVALSGAGLVIAVLGVCTIFYRSNMVVAPFLRRIEHFEGDLAGALMFCQAAGGAWIARVAAAEIRERLGETLPGSAAELAEDLRREAGRGILALITIGRAASPLAFVGVMLELGRAFQPDRGLAGLQRGLVEQTAMQSAAVGVTIGLTTSICCLVTATTLRGSARQRQRDVTAVTDFFAAPATGSVTGD